jgi:hypothetical protein
VTRSSRTRHRLLACSQVENLNRRFDQIELDLHRHQLFVGQFGGALRLLRTRPHLLQLGLQRLRSLSRSLGPRLLAFELGLCAFELGFEPIGVGLRLLGRRLGALKGLLPSTDRFRRILMPAFPALCIGPNQLEVAFELRDFRLRPAGAELADRSLTR